MIFLSRGVSPSFLMVSGYQRAVETDRGTVMDVRVPKWLKFSKLGTPMAAPNLPAKKSEIDMVPRALGFVDTEIAAREMRMSEQEIIDFLYQHPDYGVEFVSLEDESKETATQDSVFIENGDGTYYCNLCAQHLSSIQGVTGHKQSKIHQKAFELHLSEMDRAVAAAT